MIIKINKKQFAIGGEWSPIVDARNLQNTLKAKNKRFYHFYNSILGTSYLGVFTEAKLPGKVYALGTYLNDLIQHGDFVFVYEFKDKVYYAGYRDGVLDIKTEKVLSQINAKRQLQTYITENDIQRLYYLDEFSLLDGIFVTEKEAIDLKEVKSVSSAHLVKDIYKTSSSIKNAIIVIVCLSLLVLMGWYSMDLLSKHVPEVRQAVSKKPSDAEIKAFKEQIIKRNLQALYDAPYPMNIIHFCRDSKQQVPEAYGFWDRKELTCHSNTAKHIFTRNESGLVPSQFEADVMADIKQGSMSFDEKFPIAAELSIQTDVAPRDFIPQSLDQISADAARGLFDYLARFSDVETVSRFTKPNKVVIPTQKLGDYDIKFSGNDVYSKGTFLLNSTNLNRIINFVEKLDVDYLFLDKIKHSGETYEASFTYIVR